MPKQFDHNSVSKKLADSWINHRSASIYERWAADSGLDPAHFTITSSLGAIVGDIIGSRFEFNNHRSKDFDLYGYGCFATDDSITTLAVAKALLDAKCDPEKLKEIIVPTMQRLGRPYPYSGYGGRFYGWMYSDNPKPYNSFDNGAAMRVSPVAWVAKDIDEVKRLSHIVTAVSHNHPEGLKGAEATAIATFIALHGTTKDKIRATMENDYYKVDFTLDEIRPTYQFDETCQKTLPVALAAFYESSDFEDSIRNAISVGGDSDTIAAITGAIAGAHYGIPPTIRAYALLYLPPELEPIAEKFEEKILNDRCSPSSS